MRWLVSLLLVAATVDAAYVVTTSGRRIQGEKITAAADGSVTLVTAGGPSMTFKKDQYRAAKADRPKELDAAQKLFEQGKTDPAVALLRKVKADYAFLAWDQAAAALLANHFYEHERYAEAVAEFESMEALDPAARARYRAALIASGQLDAARAALNEDIASGDRDAAARAYLLRGDLKARRGDAEGARRDWLKVAMFFKAQKECAEEAEEKLKERE